VVEDGASFVRCFNCNQMAYAANNQLVPYYRLRPSLELSEAGEIMRHWMTTQAGPARLNGVAVLGAPKAYDFLFWSFSGGTAGFDRQVMIPAVHTVLRELRHFVLPSRFVNPDAALDGEDEALSPSVTRDAAAAQTGEGSPEALQTWLVRVPLYEFPYNFNGRAYRVIVDGLSGQCLVDRFPRRPVSTWLTVLVASVLAFGIEGWVLWGSGPWLALAYLATAVPAAAVTWMYLRKRREEDG
jgi:hypothetical protein